jgi:hypothetical protein
MSAVGLEIKIDGLIGSFGGMWIDFFEGAIVLELGGILVEGKVEFRMWLVGGWLFVGGFGG